MPMRTAAIDGIDAAIARCMPLPIVSWREIALRRRSAGLADTATDTVRSPCLWRRIGLVLLLSLRRHRTGTAPKIAAPPLSATLKHPRPTSLPLGKPVDHQSVTNVRAARTEQLTVSAPESCPRPDGIGAQCIPGTRVRYRRVGARSCDRASRKPIDPARTGYRWSPRWSSRQSCPRASGSAWDFGLPTERSLSSDSRWSRSNVEVAARTRYGHRGAADPAVLVSGIDGTDDRTNE